MTNKYSILIQLMLLNVIGQTITQCAATIQTEKIETELNLKLIKAAQCGSIDIVEELIKQGANVNAGNKWGDMALIRAADEGYKEIVELLIKSKADVDLKDTLGFTALMYAASKGDKQIVELLIKTHANIDAYNNIGYTALMAAVRIWNIEIVELLLRAGAYIDHKNENDQKAIDLAKQVLYYDSEAIKKYKQKVAKMIEDEPVRRKAVVKKWIKENLGRIITESTQGILIPDISNIITEYTTIEYTDIPLEYRLINKIN